MKSKKFFLYPLVLLVFLISACSDEDKNNDFSGVSDLLAERNKARKEIGKKISQKKADPQAEKPEKSNAPILKTTPQKKEISSIVLYEQNIDIVGSESGQIMAKGVAYINKNGQIVRIKILRE